MPDTKMTGDRGGSKALSIWRMLTVAAMGVLVGLILLVAHAGRAASYLSDEPEACVNCHVMNAQYATWKHSSHGRHVTCNDCHVPHNNPITKYFFKAKDGLNHSWKFTTRQEHQVITATDEARRVIQENCVHCHNRQLIHLRNTASERTCWDCHREVPHGKVRSQSATPEQMAPQVY